MSNYRMFYQTILFIIGLLFTILGIVGEVNEIWFSIGVAFMVCSSIRIIRYIRMTKNPEYKEKVEIAQKDERNITISNKAAAFAFRIGIFIICIIELCLFAFEMMELATAFGFIVCGLLILYWVAFLVYSKKL